MYLFKCIQSYYIYYHNHCPYLRHQIVSFFRLNHHQVIRDVFLNLIKQTYNKQSATSKSHQVTFTQFLNRCPFFNHLPQPFPQRQTYMLSASKEINFKILGQSYKICKKIDQGAFGQIYKAVSLKHSSWQYAVKIQSMRAEHPQLIHQCKLYMTLHTDPLAGDRGIPIVYSCGVQDEYNYLVMELMGPSLESLLSQCNRRFSLKTILMLLEHMISNIQYLHSRNYLHRDIKPDNFCMGMEKAKHRLFLLDYGLAKTYLKGHKHVQYREGKSLTGTARYASINTHKGIQQARRDDMESIGYVALYCYKGCLPWQGQKGGNKFDKYQRIKQTKINTSVEQLCRGCPDQFKIYMNAVKRLQFQEKPHYDDYKQNFRSLFFKQGFKLDWEYDWTIQALNLNQ